METIDSDGLHAALRDAHDALRDAAERQRRVLAHLADGRAHSAAHASLVDAEMRTTGIADELAYLLDGDLDDLLADVESESESGDDHAPEVDADG